MVRKIELGVFLQQLVASQRGPGVGRAAVGQAGRVLGDRASFQPHGHQRAGGDGMKDAKGKSGERRGCSDGGRAVDSTAIKSSDFRDVTPNV